MPANAQVALITGAGSGLGRQLALLLAAETWTIAATDIQLAGLQSLEAQLQSQGATVACAVADVTDAVGLHKAVQSLEERLGPVDLLIANAGIGFETPALNFDAAAFASIIGVNLVGVANSIAAVLPGMLARGHGHIVAISSLASYRGLPSLAGYCSSKSGVNALMESLRVQLRPRGICVTTVCPGWIRTPMTEPLKLRVPLLQVDDAARRVVAAIRKRKAFVAYPWRARWLVALLRWLPVAVSDGMLRGMTRAVEQRSGRRP